VRHEMGAFLPEPGSAKRDPSTGKTDVQEKQMHTISRRRPTSTKGSPALVHPIADHVDNAYEAPSRLTRPALADRDSNVERIDQAPLAGSGIGPLVVLCFLHQRAVAFPAAVSRDAHAQLGPRPHQPGLRGGNRQTQPGGNVRHR
jgi:hypothetical protein